MSAIAATRTPSTYVLDEPYCDNLGGDQLTVLGHHVVPSQRHTGSTVLPLVSLTCDVCRKAVDFATERYSVSRVNGDSKYGYEPHHDACLAAFMPDEDTTPMPSAKAEMYWEDGRLYTVGGRCLERDVTLDEACAMYRDFAVTVKVQS